jgi:two-component system LytT family response regulator
MWALSDIERMSKIYTSFSRKLAAALIKHNDTASAVRLLLKLLDRNELDEETYRLLLNTYAAQKDKASLAKQYMRYEKTLHKELGIRPSKEFVHLYDSLMSVLDEDK